jgi:phosphatidylglycerol:prolipoprotein diacylglycerol transferase
MRPPLLTLPLPQGLLPLMFAGLALLACAVSGVALVLGKRRAASVAAAGVVAALAGWSAARSRSVELGSFVIEAFGLALALGVALGSVVASRLARANGLDSSMGADALVGLGAGAFAGARLLYVLGSPERESAREILAFGAGGLSGYGAWIGGVAVAAALLHRRKQPLLPWGDVGAPGALLATSVTRLGCYVAGCDFGEAFAAPAPGAAGAGGGALHPTQLYEAFGALVLFVACLWLRRLQRRHGAVFQLALVGYALLRLAVEPFRGDADRGFWAWMSVTSWCAWGTLAGFVCVRAVRYVRAQPGGSTSTW